MSWTCEGEHKPVRIGEGIYCAKCGTRLEDSTPVPLKNVTASQFLNNIGRGIDAGLLRRLLK